MSDFTFQKAKKNRNEHNLPILYFNVADDWIDKLGNDAFVAWLKFYSWCDRSPERIDPDNDVVPSSLSKIMKRLGVGKKKFYNQIIRPLWNYGLIDLVEYEHSIQSGNKPINIVVYEYPQNNRQKKYEPLEQVRDYDKDYNTSSRGFAKQGGRKNKNIGSGGFQKKPGVVSHGNTIMIQIILIMIQIIFSHHHLLNRRKTMTMRKKLIVSNHYSRQLNKMTN
ncbi:hypothetical protein [Bacillus sp. CJ1]|uniref:hypothetical protein n=1 Tax=Bacillus sp. CJ1 TaxID=3373600 RepID=UPI003F91003C